jgi:hypothetical protein
VYPNPAVVTFMVLTRIAAVAVALLPPPPVKLTVGALV